MTKYQITPESASIKKNCLQRICQVSNQIYLHTNLSLIIYSKHLNYEQPQNRNYAELRTDGRSVIEQPFGILNPTRSMACSVYSYKFSTAFERAICCSITECKRTSMNLTQLTCLNTELVRYLDVDCSCKEPPPPVFPFALAGPGNGRICFLR